MPLFSKCWFTIAFRQSYLLTTVWAMHFSDDSAWNFLSFSRHLRVLFFIVVTLDVVFLRSFAHSYFSSSSNLLMNLPTELGTLFGFHLLIFLHRIVVCFYDPIIVLLFMNRLVLVSFLNLSTISSELLNWILSSCGQELWPNLRMFPNSFMAFHLYLSHRMLH